jgi:hypothetical protein
MTSTPIFPLSASLRYWLVLPISVPSVIVAL